MSRVIIHLDMDAFFAAIEQLDFPELRGKAVIVGGSPDARGVVSTCSYEARRFGVHSAMPLGEAYRRCPHGIFVPGRMTRYSEVSRQVFAVMSDFSPLMERVSVDEAFLDVTASQPLFGDGETIARRIQQRVWDELGLGASLGVAPNKFVAKVASDLRKPRGLVVVNPGEAAGFLAPLPVEKIWGVGERTAASLHKLGIRTIRQLQQTSPQLLQQVLGVYGQRLWELARGIDERPVEETDEVKSVGNEHTFDHDISDPEVLKSTLLHLASKVGRRLRRKGFKGRTITLKLRYLDFTTFTRQAACRDFTDFDQDIYRVATALFDRLFDGRPVRLLGISVSQLAGMGEGAVQMDIFAPSTDRARALTEAMDGIRNRHGEKSITYGKITEHPPE